MRPVRRLTIVAALVLRRPRGDRDERPRRILPTSTPYCALRAVAANNVPVTGLPGAKGFPRASVIVPKAWKVVSRGTGEHPLPDRQGRVPVPRDVQARLKTGPAGTAAGHVTAALPAAAPPYVEDSGVRRSYAWRVVRQKTRSAPRRHAGRRDDERLAGPSDRAVGLERARRIGAARERRRRVLPLRLLPRGRAADRRRARDEHARRRKRAVIGASHAARATSLLQGVVVSIPPEPATPELHVRSRGVRRGDSTDPRSARRLRDVGAVPSWYPCDGAAPLSLATIVHRLAQFSCRPAQPPIRAQGNRHIPFGS